MAAQNHEALLLILLALLLVAGCAHRSPETAGPEERIVWPPPPAPSRIEYLGSVSVPSDLGIRTGKFARFFSYLAGGRRPVGMARPFGIAVATDARIAVADPDARVVHVYDPERSRYRRISELDESGFASPVGVAFGSGGELYVADSALGTVNRFDRKGRWKGRLGEEDLFRRPTSLAYDRQRALLYVVDTGAHRLVALDGEGRRVRTIGRRGTGEGEFNYPVAVAIGPSGRLFVTDAMNFRVQVFDPDGEPSHSFGQAGTSPGDMDKSKGIAVDSDGHVYVADALHDVVQVFDDRGHLLTVIGGTGTGPGQFWLPAGLHIDAGDRILVADSANHRIQILRYLGDGRQGGGS